jgi:hypothetical protein
MLQKNHVNKLRHLHRTIDACIAFATAHKPNTFFFQGCVSLCAERAKIPLNRLLSFFMHSLAAIHSPLGLPVALSPDSIDSLERNRRMMGIVIVFYLLLAHGKRCCKWNSMCTYLTSASRTGIERSQTLVCYSCSGGQSCGTLFSFDSPTIKKITSRGNDSFSSCSVRRITPNVDGYLFTSCTI